MKITEEQRNLLDSLVCERLRDNPQNKRLVQLFCNKRNDGIAETLRKKAWTEDCDGDIAYYVSKSSSDEVLFFFSLKCGGLHNSLNEDYFKLVSKITKI